MASFFLYINLFMYFWLHWVFVAVRGLSLVTASGATPCHGSQPLTTVASLVAEHGL